MDLKGIAESTVEILNQGYYGLPDGKRFSMMKEVVSTDRLANAEAPRKINIVLNWLEELKQRVPTS